MPVLPPPAPAPLTYVVQDIINDALIEIGMLAPGEQPDGDTAEWAFRKANYVLDTWAARENYVYNSTFARYTLVPGLLPHTIGPSPTATYQVRQRPVKIIRANVILTGTSPEVEAPELNIRDAQWWMSVTTKNIRTPQPTDLFYSPNWPDGQLYFWPVPSAANDVRLETWVLLEQFVSITDPLGGPASSTMSLPPGYRNALMLTLAETLQPGGEKEPNSVLSAAAAAARLAVFGNNSGIPRMQTRDSGVPGGRNSYKETSFNYKSRSY